MAAPQASISIFMTNSGKKRKEFTAGLLRGHFFDTDGAPEQGGDGLNLLVVGQGFGTGEEVLRAAVALLA